MVVYTAYTLRKKDIFLCEPRALAINKYAVRHGAQPCPKWSHSL